MDNSESESRDEPETPEIKSNAFLVGLALNLGRATRTARNGLDAIGVTASNVGASIKSRKIKKELAEETGESKSSEIVDSAKAGAAAADVAPSKKEKKAKKTKKEDYSTELDESSEGETK